MAKAAAMAVIIITTSSSRIEKPVLFLCPAECALRLFHMNSLTSLSLLFISGRRSGLMGTRWHSRRGTSTAKRRDVNKSFKNRWLQAGEDQRFGPGFIWLGRKVTSCVRAEPTKLENPRTVLLRDFVEGQNLEPRNRQRLLNPAIAVADA